MGEILVVSSSFISFYAASYSMWCKKLFENPVCQRINGSKNQERSHIIKLRLGREIQMSCETMLSSSREVLTIDILLCTSKLTHNLDPTNDSKYLI